MWCFRKICSVECYRVSGGFREATSHEREPPIRTTDALDVEAISFLSVKIRLYVIQVKTGGWYRIHRGIQYIHHGKSDHFLTSDRLRDVYDLEANPKTESGYLG